MLPGYDAWRLSSPPEPRADPNLMEYVSDHCGCGGDVWRRWDAVNAEPMLWCEECNRRVEDEEVEK